MLTLKYLLWQPQCMFSVNGSVQLLPICIIMDYIRKLYSTLEFKMYICEWNKTIIPMQGNV